jgi:hypothetical protein
VGFRREPCSSSLKVARTTSCLTGGVKPAPASYESAQASSTGSRRRRTAVSLDDSDRSVQQSVLDDRGRGQDRGETLVIVSPIRRSSSTLGPSAPDSARMVPKSVSVVIRTRCSRCAHARTSSSVAPLHPDRPNVARIVTDASEPFGQPILEGLVDQEPHADCSSGIVR